MDLLLFCKKIFLIWYYVNTLKIIQIECIGGIYTNKMCYRLKRNSNCWLIILYKDAEANILNRDQVHRKILAEQRIGDYERDVQELRIPVRGQS